MHSVSRGDSELHAKVDGDAETRTLDPGVALSETMFTRSLHFFTWSGFYGLLDGPEEVFRVVPIVLSAGRVMVYLNEVDALVIATFFCWMDVSGVEGWVGYDVQHIIAHDFAT